MIMHRLAPRPAKGSRRSARARCPANGGINLCSTGQGSASTPKISAGQRGRIVTIFRDYRVAPAKLDVPVHQGVQLPAGLQYHPLPADVIAVYPEWRGHTMVANEILIIDPTRRKIVEILQL